MTDQLRALLHRLLIAGGSRPALDRLLDDYARYHLVLVVLGSALTVALGALAVRCARRFRRAPRNTDRRWSFERTTYAGFAIASGLLVLVLGLVVLANLSNVLDPRHGFTGAVDAIATARPGTPRAELHDVFAQWLRSDADAIPPVVQEHVDDRLAWQRPKALISAVLLVAAVALAHRLWHGLIERSRRRPPRTRWSGADRARFAVALALGPVALVLTAMVLGNAQASIAPLTMTLLFG
ncbi:MAG TPA: hypothetical protein VNS19_04655 [Acidimicrobiales bacterium]|nr:hypothetical protein [Acidimicrobiales bacterium]